MPAELHGVLVVDKPRGLSSAQVVNEVKRRLGVERAGHTGTLDPLATGVLPVCLGDATRLAGWMIAEDKAYDAELELGAATDTLDATGTIVSEDRAGAARVTLAELVAALARLAGTTEQVPPMFSAIRQGKQRLHQLARAGEVVAWIELADGPRPEARDAVARLREAGIRRLVMLTGDNRDAADQVARASGVDEVLAGLLPEDKVLAVRGLAERYGSVAMVGDGVNDAPALAAATVGIAMGAAGSASALETADIALMGDDLGRLPYLYALSRRARAVIRQNVALSLLIKGALALGVPFGVVPLVAAVLLGDMGVSLVVTLNALRLGRVS